MAGILLVQTAKESLDAGSEDFKPKFGITCFSEINDDLLMWAHYGGRYEGVCLEFDATLTPFNEMKKVEYVEDMPSVSVDFMFATDDPRDNHLYEDVHRLYRTKSKAWKYEREWRVFHTEPNSLVPYDTDAMKAAYFGPNCPDESIDEVRSILSAQHPNATLWKGSLSEKEFKMEFKQLD